ncbi:MAG: hypothetical protein FJW61_00355 [Actinobacteria bacterium]|nr:hypothetical protein [Actinomycetota bacterium]
MKKVFFITIISISLALIIFSLVSSGCGKIISIEGVELRKVEKAKKEPLEEEKNIEFTPEGSLSIGSFVLFGKYQVESEDPIPILWRVIENKSHYRGNVNPDEKHMTLLAEYIIDLRGFDAEEPESEWEFRAKYGNNRYRFSTLRQWLNSSKKAYNWWEPQHETDAEPVDENFKSNRPTGYEDKDGFLNSFTPEELGLILDTNLECGINSNADGGGIEVVTDKIFLLSLTEVGLSEEESKNYFEGNPFVIFNSYESRLAIISLQCYENTESVQKSRTPEASYGWWLRSPYSWGEYDVWNVDNQGKAEHRRAHLDAFGVRPALNIKYEGLTFLGSGTIDDPYIIE